MSTTARNPVKAVETTFLILDVLKELDGAGVTELSDHLDIPKSTVHSYLSTLYQEEYVVKEGDKYYVSSRFLDFGIYARNRKRIYDIAKPEVDRLAEETGNYANLLIEEHGRGVYLLRTDGNRAVKSNTRTGTVVDLHATALGKAILANFPESRVREILDRHGMPSQTPNSITDRDALFQELETIRERGYAIDDEEWAEGLRCVAAPVMENGNEVIGSISVSGPTSRFRGPEAMDDVADAVLEAANVIELNMKYS